MSKKKDREQLLREEFQQVRQQSERQVEAFFLDRDPVKQYVRHFGWLQVIQDYVKRRLSDDVNRPLTYLTFPGPSAPDIGLLWQAGLLVRTSYGFPRVVICDMENADKALKVLGTVWGVSRRPFHEAVKAELVPYFPFDVINLDIYGAVVTGSEERDKALRTMEGIQRVFCLQKGQGFLLLLTTSTDDQSARRHLEDVLWQNFNEDGFKEAYISRYKVLDASPFQNDYRSFVGLVLPKAIGKMARDRGYRITEHFVAKYDRKNHHMLCHSFELEPLGGREPAKKYEPRFKKTEWDVLTEELSSRVRNFATNAYAEFIPTLVERDPLDIPEILRANPDLETEMKRDAELLIGWEKSHKPK